MISSMISHNDTSDIDLLAMLTCSRQDIELPLLIYNKFYCSLVLLCVLFLNKTTYRHGISTFENSACIDR